MKWSTLSTSSSPFSSSVIVCKLAFFSLLLWTCVVEARHTRFTCQGGRGEGDKWFDGCRWCVCQLDGPMCSPASCSHLVTQVPPCDNVGSRWKDGCYDCTCYPHGIECVADTACVVLMRREEFLFCVEPEDDRCVCGVDGTPSCTAEVIDRNAHPATTIALDTSFDPPQRYKNDDDDDDDDDDDNKPRDFDDSDDQGHHRGVWKRSTVDEYLRRREKIRKSYNNVKNRDRRSSYLKPYRFFNRLGGYYNYADVENGYPNRGYHANHKANQRKHHRSYDNKEPTMPSDSEDRGRHNYDEMTRDFVNDETPRSLLIITNNRCRYGARWYGGGLRCYCNGDGSITCGDPKFVASRIDGFRLDKTRCEEGHAWYDESQCQICECKISGVLLCRRSESCPLPFLIEPVSDSESTEVRDQHSNKAGSDEDNGVISASKKTVDRWQRLKSHSRFPWRSEDTKVGHASAESADDKTMDLPYDSSRKPSIIIDRDRNDLYNPYNKQNKTGNKKHTTVIVTECNPGSKWLDGCKRCSCDYHGRKHCDEKRCLKPPVPHFRPRDMKSMDFDQGRPFQRPPKMPIIRNKPVQIKSPFPEDKPCGRFKVGQRYFIKCNRCLCTPHGPKCTAINCDYSRW